MQAADAEENFWEFEFPLWKQIPSFCDSSAPDAPLRFHGLALVGGHVLFRMRLAPSLVGSPITASTAPLLITLAAADGSLPEVYAEVQGCVVIPA